MHYDVPPTCWSGHLCYLYLNKKRKLNGKIDMQIKY